MASRAFRWLDKRTGVHEILKVSLDEPIPGGARLAYVFGSGLLFIFISQIITGICLALYYVPSAETAHTSVAYITKQVAAGAFLRSLHYYGSSAMIIVLALHFLQTFLYGSFKGRRELLWISGAVLSFLVLGMGFTGYLLPWDQKAYFATAVGTNIVGEVPWAGAWMTRLLRGGDVIGTLTLSRFYVAHVFVIPACIFAFIGAHIMLFRKAGPAGPIKEDPINPKLAPEGFYPRQVIMDMALALLLMIGLGFLSYFHPETLGPVANPADTTFLPRPEWYYLPMFQWLKYWEGPKVVLAVVVVPGLLALAFFLIPFLDRSLERRPWRRPIPVLAVAFVVFGMVFLGARSHIDDKRDPGTAAQIATQEAQEKAYTAEPFEPYVESPGGTPAPASATGPSNPQVSRGKAVFTAHGCAGCHGEAGAGGIATKLVGISAKYPAAQLTALLHDPNAQMRAGKMPAVDVSSADMAALVAYLGVLGTSAANVPADVNMASTGVAAVEGSATEPAPTTPQAAAGLLLYQSTGCIACHGPGGSGGREPALATLLAQLSDAQLTQLLRNPNAKMKAGGMAAVTLPAKQVSSLITYLRGMRAAPPSPEPPVAEAASSPAETPAPSANAPAATIANTAPVTATTAAGSTATKPSAGRTLFMAQGCAACHGASGEGTHFAPSLLGIGAKFPGDAMPTLLRHPTSAMRNGGMPAVTVDDAQLQQLIRYLDSLNTATQAASLPASGKPSANSAGPTKSANATGAAQTPDETARQVAALALNPEEQFGQKVFQRNACETCHGIAGLQGTVAAPGLAGTASILPAATLENLLRHHSIRMKKGGMPLTNMNAKDMQALVAYIRSMTPAAGAQ